MVHDELGRQRDASTFAAQADWLQGKRVLITGGGGSIGGEHAVQVQQLTGPMPFLLDRDDEHLCRTLYRLDPTCNLVRPELVLADIRDRTRIFEVFSGIKPQVVFHAAAMKDVVLGEAHPSEAVKTNVDGSCNVMD